MRLPAGTGPGHQAPPWPRRHQTAVTVGMPGEAPPRPRRYQTAVTVRWSAGSRSETPGEAPPRRRRYQTAVTGGMEVPPCPHRHQTAVTGGTPGVGWHLEIKSDAQGGFRYRVPRLRVGLGGLPTRNQGFRYHVPRLRVGLVGSADGQAWGQHQAGGLHNRTQHRSAAAPAFLANAATAGSVRRRRQETAVTVGTSGESSPGATPVVRATPCRTAAYDFPSSSRRYGYAR
jgi:hypothetical protein